MHVYCWVLECGGEALFFDCALFADVACLFDVGDVFVFFWEHEVGFPFAVGLVVPCLWGGWYSLYIG